jgi:hypothetical protein
MIVSVPVTLSGGVGKAVTDSAISVLRYELDLNES